MQCFFLLDRYAPAQHSIRRSASFSSYAACRKGLTVDDRGQTNDRSGNIPLERQIRTHQSVRTALIGQVR
jgi:hypothetical protein